MDPQSVCRPTGTGSVACVSGPARWVARFRLRYASRAGWSYEPTCRCPKERFGDHLGRSCRRPGAGPDGPARADRILKMILWWPVRPKTAGRPWIWCGALDQT